MKQAYRSIGDVFSITWQNSVAKGGTSLNVVGDGLLEDQPAQVCMVCLVCHVNMSLDRCVCVCIFIIV